MLKVDACLMANRLELVKDKLEEIITYCEGLAEAGLEMASNPHLGSPYEGARMLHETATFAKRCYDWDHCSYEELEPLFNDLRERLQAYVTLHKGFAIMAGLLPNWKQLPDLLDFTKDLSRVDHIDPSKINYDVTYRIFK